jgi:chromosome segregation ATPase
MNEFTIFNGTIWFSDADSVYKHLYPECGFEVESLGVSDRFVSEDAFIAQRNLKDEYMRRDTKHMETISELRKQLEEKQDYIKTLEERINNQKNVINKIYGAIEAADITNPLSRKIASLNVKLEDLEKLEELQNENKVLKERLKDATGIEYTDSTDYIAQLHKNVLNQRKELRNLNKALERERKRNKELEELYSGAQRDVSMLNLKVMELNQGIRNSEDLTWKEKYNELEAKYKSDSAALTACINELKRCSKDDNKQNDETCKKLLADLDHIAERCSKAEHTIDAIKEALEDGGYISRCKF